jgi:hypothetical protein
MGYCCGLGPAAGTGVVGTEGAWSGVVYDCAACPSTPTLVLTQSPNATVSPPLHTDTHFPPPRPTHTQAYWHYHRHHYLILCENPVMATVYPPPPPSPLVW